MQRSLVRSGLKNACKNMKTTTVKQKLKSLRRLLNHLYTDRVVILVEGKRDIHALRRLQLFEGYDSASRILQISSRKPSDVVQLLSEGETGKEVIILTDYDRSGKKLKARYAEELMANNFSVDLQTGRTLQWIFGVRTIEELPHAYADFVAEAVLSQQQVGWNAYDALCVNGNVNGNTD